MAVMALTLTGCSSTAHHAAAPSIASTTATSTPRAAVIPAHPAGSSIGCKASATDPPGTTDLHLVSGGVQRSYELVVPPSYTGKTPYPLVFGLHSLTVDYRVVYAISGFSAMQARYPVIGVMPSGRASPAPYWNAAPVANNYDLTYINALLDHLERTLCLNTAEIYSVGMSNGAQMSSLLACRLDGRIDGIAAISGVEFNQPCPGPPTPVIAFHGRRDPIVPYRGGGLNSVTIANETYYKGHLPPGTARPTGVDETMRRWADHNGCDTAFTQRRVSSEVELRTWQHCKAPTMLYIIDNGGHGWPGLPQPAFEARFGHDTTQINATRLMFAFFFAGTA
jgi:polyhydroxybutyrate depolymerase